MARGKKSTCTNRGVFNRRYLYPATLLPTDYINTDSDWQDQLPPSVPPDQKKDVATYQPYTRVLVNTWADIATVRW